MLVGKKAKVTDMVNKRITNGYISGITQQGVWLSKTVIPGAALRRKFRATEPEKIENYKHHFFSWWYIIMEVAR